MEMRNGGSRRNHSSFQGDVECKFVNGRKLGKTVVARGLKFSTRGRVVGWFTGIKFSIVVAARERLLAGHKENC
jgi:hypothetical protein